MHLLLPRPPSLLLAAVPPPPARPDAKRTCERAQERAGQQSPRAHRRARVLVAVRAALRGGPIPLRDEEEVQGQLVDLLEEGEGEKAGRTSVTMKSQHCPTSGSFGSPPAEAKVPRIDNTQKLADADHPWDGVALLAGMLEGRGRR